MKFQWVDLHITHNMPVTRVAEMAKVHHSTVYRWLEAYEDGGIEALVDGSRAPKKQSGEYSDEIKNLIRVIRKNGLKNEKRYLGENVIAHRLEKRYGTTVSHSGVGQFLRRDGLIPEQRKRRRPKKERVKRCRIHAPGELLQLDVKYAVKSFANYWFYQYDAIDYVSGIVRGEIYSLQSNF